MRRPRAGLAPCVRDALGLPSAPTKWGRLHWLDAGQSPREPVGSDPARIDNSICPRPGSTVPGSEIAAHDKAQPAQAWLGGAPQGARVSLWRERCAPLRREVEWKATTLRFAALRPPRYQSRDEEYGRTRRRPNNTGDDARLRVIGATCAGCLTITSGRRAAMIALTPPHPEGRAKRGVSKGEVAPARRSPHGSRQLAVALTSWGEPPHHEASRDMMAGEHNHRSPNSSPAPDKPPASTRRRDARRRRPSSRSHASSFSARSSNPCSPCSPSPRRPNRSSHSAAARNRHR